MIALWVPWHLGVTSVPSAFAPAIWHSHDLLLGKAGSTPLDDKCPTCKA
jgi:uncharacterized protein involved in response to NO